MNTGGNGSNYIKYKEKSKFEIYTDGEERVTISNGGMTVAGDTSTTGDINAAGGFAQSFTFSKIYLLQNSFASMTASYNSASLQGDSRGPVHFLEVPMVRGGSIRGLVVSVASSAQTIKSGALSASVMINGVNAACTAVGHTGTYIVKTLDKDAVTFTAGQRIGVSISASTGYLSEPDVVSASFIASVLVEM